MTPKYLTTREGPTDIRRKDGIKIGRVYRQDRLHFSTGSIVDQHLNGPVARETFVQYVVVVFGFLNIQGGGNTGFTGQVEFGSQLGSILSKLLICDNNPETTAV